ncbi:MAG: molybdopterin molybdotransferase MoeA [Thermoproteales archaeon]|nr:molybdopterin molybdotransferase MoeA [Thermoproteales archaeon]
MWRLYSIEEVIKGTVKHLEKKFDEEEINVLDALNRFSAREYYSLIDLPPYPKSTMDGYAVLSSDCSGASENSPIFLEVLTEVIRSGEKPTIKISQGKCVKIETGGFLPKGADAVIPIEDVILSKEHIEVTKPLSKYENVSLPSEELSRDDKIIEEGELIRPWHISTLYASRYRKIFVKKINAGIIYTGDEFKNGENIPYTNYLVKGWLEENGFKVTDIIYSNDDPFSIRSSVQRLLSKNTFIVILGGTSKGDWDYVYNGLEKLASNIYRGVRMKPGKTTTIYVIDGKPVFSISGLPAAAFSSLELIIKKILFLWLHLRYLSPPKIKAKLNRRVTSKLGFVSFTRVRVFEREGELFAEPLVSGGSGSLRSLVLGNGYIVVPEHVEGFDKGDLVEVVLYGSIKKNI